MMRAFPFTIVTLVIYNIVIIFSGASVWDNVLFDLTLFSGQDWALRTGDVMVLAGLLVLLAEVLRATSIERQAITSHPPHLGCGAADLCSRVRGRRRGRYLHLLHPHPDLPG